MESLGFSCVRIQSLILTVPDSPSMTIPIDVTESSPRIKGTDKFLTTSGLRLYSGPSLSLTCTILDCVYDAELVTTFLQLLL